MALIGVATILLGGCSETSQFGNPFGSSFASSNPRVDSTPTGSVDASPSPMTKVSNFFAETFKPFDSQPARSPAPHSGDAARYATPEYNHPVPPEPIASAPLAAPASNYRAPAPAYASAPRPTYALRANPNSVGGWTAEGGTPVVVAQGESAGSIAQRYGVPVATLLTLNGYAPHANLAPGTRLTIPVYRAKGARTAAAAAPAPQNATARAQKAEHQRLAARSPAGDEAAVTSHGQKLRWTEGKAPARTAASGAQGRLVQSKMAKLDQGAPAASVDRMPTVKNDAGATASLPSPAMAASSDSANPEFRWPARGRVIQGYGSGGNDGINIAVPEGTQVKAAESGTVVYAGSELKGYGNLVLIRHPNGFVSAYANNGSLEVKRGQSVRRGQTIALSGQSGDVSSPQLHFELRKGAKPVDPSKYLAGL